MTPSTEAVIPSRFLSLLFSMLLFLPALAQAPPPLAPTGLSMVEQKRYTEALPLLETEMGDDPTNLDLRLGQAQCLLELGRWTEGLAAAAALLERHPQDPRPRLLKGDVLFVLFRVQEALETWKPLLANPAAAGEALPRVLNGLVATRRFEEAEDLAKGARAGGLPVSDAALRLEYRAARRCEGRQAAAEALSARHPGEADTAEEVAIQKAICLRGGESTAPPPEGPSSVRIREQGGRPLVPVLLDGRRKAWLVLDTGSQALLLSRPIIRKLGLAKLGEGSCIGMGAEGARPSPRYLLPRLDAAGLGLVNASVMESEGSRDGVIGLGPFLDGVMDYDRRRGHLSLWPAGTAPEAILDGEAAVLPVLWVRGMPLVPVKVGGLGPFPFLLDTGAAFTIVAAEFAPLAGVRVNSAKYQTGAGKGASGVFTVGFAEGVRLEVGGRAEDFPWIRVSEVPQRFPVPVFGILGADLLADYRIVFDGPGCRVAFQPYRGGSYRDPLLQRPPRGLSHFPQGAMPQQQQPPPAAPRKK